MQFIIIIIMPSNLTKVLNYVSGKLKRQRKEKCVRFFLFFVENIIIIIKIIFVPVAQSVHTFFFSSLTERQLRSHYRPEREERTRKGRLKKRKRKRKIKMF